MVYTHAVGKNREIYVGCVHMVWGKAELIMWDVYTGCGE